MHLTSCLPIKTLKAPFFRVTKDAHEHPLWNPGTMFESEDDTGMMQRFDERFGTMGGNIDQDAKGRENKQKDGGDDANLDELKKSVTAARQERLDRVANLKSFYSEAVSGLKDTGDSSAARVLSEGSKPSRQKKKKSGKK